MQKSKIVNSRKNNFRKGPSKLEQTCITSCIACCPCCISSESSEAGDLEREKSVEKWRFPFLPKFHFKTKKLEGPPSDEKKEKRGFFGRKSIVEVTRMSKRGKIEDSPIPSRKSANETKDNFDDSEPETPERLKAPAVIRSISHDLPRENSGDSINEKKRRNSAEDIPLAMRISNFFQLRKDGPSFVTFNEDKLQYERTLSSTGKTV
jgi:hypothetical protein